MDQKNSLTEFGRISKDAVPAALTLAQACAIDGVQARMFTLLRSLLRGEALDLTELPAEVIAEVPRLRALDRRSLELVGGLFGDVGADGDPSNDPTLTAIGILMTGRAANAVTIAELRRLIEVFKEPGAPIPTGLSQHGAEAAQIMQLLSPDCILEMESWFFGEDPATARQESVEDE